MDFKK